MTYFSMPTDPTGISFVYSSNIKDMSLSNLSWFFLPFQLCYTVCVCVCVTMTCYFIKKTDKMLSI